MREPPDLARFRFPIETKTINQRRPELARLVRSVGRPDDADIAEPLLDKLVYFADLAFVIEIEAAMKMVRKKTGRRTARVRPPASNEEMMGFIEAIPPEKLDVVVAAISRSSEGRAALLKAAAELAGIELMPADAVPFQNPSIEDLDTESLIQAAGGMLTVTEVANLLRQTRQSVHEMIKAGRILGVRFGNKWHLPAIQFRQHQVQPGLAVVLQGMGDLDPWRKLQVLLAASEPEERRPIELLRRGEKGRALAIAARAAAAVRLAAGAPLRTSIHPELDADLEADLRRDREIDATELTTGGSGYGDRCIAD